jgi:hypothetical protein
MQKKSRNLLAQNVSWVKITYKVELCLTEKARSCTTISFIAYLATALTSSLADAKAGRR